MRNAMATIDVPPDSSAARAASHVPRGAITLAMYDRMIAAGVFDPADDHPVELISGDLHMMSPIGDPHADAVDFLTRFSLLSVDPKQVCVRVQNPLALPDSQSAPQPDIAWVTFRRYVDRRPLPREVMLVIEVADSSLAFDMSVKAALYAEAGIAEYWVVDLTGKAIVVLRDPRAGGYETRSTHRAGEPITPLASPHIHLDPAELFHPSAGNGLDQPTGREP
jgi:Uma2 family endonuclease